MIKHISFKHGWFYHYRLHVPKIDKAAEKFPKLKEYLNLVYDNCPDEKFTNGPRSSKLRFDLKIPPVEVKGHEISDRARIGLSHETKLSAHSKVQLHMLNDDQTTLAVEVPIWIEPNELEQFEKFFGENEYPLSGHIDALRVEGNHIWIWDFKPKAEKEKYATTQVYFYALMLSKRCGIPLDKFKCGYFDEKTAYVFKPCPSFCNNFEC